MMPICKFLLRGLLLDIVMELNPPHPIYRSQCLISKKSLQTLVQKKKETTFISQGITECVSQIDLFID